MAMIWWIAPAGFAVTALGLLIAAAASSQETSTSLYIVLPIVIGLSLLSIVIQLPFRTHQHEYNVDDVDVHDDEETGTSVLSDSNASMKSNMIDALDDKLRPPSLSITLVVAPSIALFWLIFLRLIVGKDHFEGVPSNLDFGPVDGVEGGDRNIAFEAGGDSSALMHSLLGEFSAFLMFPAVSRIIAALLNGQGRRTVMSLSQVVSAALTFYPMGVGLIIYLSSAESTFASSTYVSDACEWALGYCVGMSAGFFVTALVEKGLLANLENDSPYEIEAKEEENVDKILWHGFLRFLHFMFGILLVFTVFASSILFGYTWNSCMDDSTDCVNFSSNGEFDLAIGMSFLFVPVVCIAHTIAWERARS